MHLIAHLVFGRLLRQPSTHSPVPSKAIRFRTVHRLAVFLLGGGPAAGEEGTENWYWAAGEGAGEWLGGR